MLKIEDWAILGHPLGITVPKLNGKVYGHTKFVEGESIITSAIIGKRNGRVVTKSGSEYILGKVNLDYEREYPGALERVMESLVNV